MAAAAPPPLPPELLAAVRRHWGFSSLRPLQERAMRAALAGRDSLVVLPTGGGKSLCYQAPAVVRDGLAVVVSPLIALMKDQVDGLTRIGVPAVRLDSTLTPSEKADAARAIRSGEVRLVFTSPERLVNTGVCDYLRGFGVHTVAVDEAHCVSHWGHDFRPEYRQLSRLREFFPGAAVHAYTATATEQVRRDIAGQLGLRSPDVLVGSFDRPNLTYRVVPRADVLAQIRSVIDRHPGDAGIVYCLRRKDVDDTTAALKRKGYRATAYHAGMNPDDRRRAQEAFSAEEVDVVVATVAFGMGIDRSNVRYVIHAAMPKSIEHYQQETGRAGRDGLPSECVLLHSGSDFFVLKSMVVKSAEEAGGSAEFVRASLGHLGEMMNYCRNPGCRHAALVRYFGQDYAAPNCGACDVCLGNAREVPDSTVVAQKILSCVARVKEVCGPGHVVDVLRGSESETVSALGHHQLSTFGLLKEASADDLHDWVDQLVRQGLLARTGEPEPVLKLNRASWAVMRGEGAVRLFRPGDAAAGGPATLPPGADADLFEVLRQLRRQEATRAGVRPEQVFTDAVLAELARGRPTTEAALGRVSGVGEFRLNSFGRAFVKAIAAHCRRTGLETDVPRERPRPKARAKPAPGGSLVAIPKVSAVKALALGLFRKGASVADVMQQTGMTRPTVVGYLADFVRAERPESIFRWVAEDVCERVAAAAEIHGTEKLKPIFAELNEEVAYDDIRVVLAFLESRGG